MKRNHIRASFIVSAALFGMSCLTALAAGEGWYEDEHGWYYHDASGELVTDTWIIDKIGTTPNLIAYYVAANGMWDEDAVYHGCEGDWMEDGNGWWFQRKDDSYPKNEYEYINEKWYFFDAAGYMETGLVRNEEIGAFCYFYPDGALAQDAGWLALPDGSWIYVRGSYCISGMATPDGYQMDENAKWQKGAAQTIESQTLALTVPASWEGKYMYDIWEDENIRLYEKVNHANGFGGQLMTIRVGTEEEFSYITDILPGKLLKRNGDNVCFVTYPSDVQWDPAHAAEYEALHNDLSRICDSIIVKSFICHLPPAYPFNQAGK